MQRTTFITVRRVLWRLGAALEGARPALPPEVQGEVDEDIAALVRVLNLLESAERSSIRHGDTEAYDVLTESGN